MTTNMLKNIYNALDIVVCSEETRLRFTTE